MYQGVRKVSMKSVIPSGSEVVREAIIVMAGALLAVVVVRALPQQWQQWFNFSGGSQQ